MSDHKEEDHPSGNTPSASRRGSLGSLGSLVGADGLSLDQQKQLIKSMRTLKEKLKDALGKLKQAATKISTLKQQNEGYAGEISTLKQQNEGYAREISTLKQENSVHVDRIAETDATGAEGGAGSADVLAWEAKCADLERTHAALTLGLKAQNTDMRKKLQTYELAAALADEGVALGPSGEEKQGQEQEQRRMAVDKAWEDKWAAREQALREGFEAKLTAATATAATAAAPPASASLSAVQQVPVSVGGAVAGAGDDLAEIRAEETAALRLDIQTLASSLHEALLRNQGLESAEAVLRQQHAAYVNECESSVRELSSTHRAQVDALQLQLARTNATVAALNSAMQQSAEGCRFFQQPSSLGSSSSPGGAHPHSHSHSYASTDLSRCLRVLERRLGPEEVAAVRLLSEQHRQQRQALRARVAELELDNARLTRESSVHAQASLDHALKMRVHDSERDVADLSRAVASMQSQMQMQMQEGALEQSLLNAEHRAILEDVRVAAQQQSVLTQPHAHTHTHTSAPVSSTARSNRGGQGISERERAARTSKRRKALRAQRARKKEDFLLEQLGDLSQISSDASSSGAKQSHAHTHTRASRNASAASAAAVAAVDASVDRSLSLSLAASSSFVRPIGFERARFRPGSALLQAEAPGNTSTHSSLHLHAQTRTPERHATSARFFSPTHTSPVKPFTSQFTAYSSSSSSRAANTYTRALTHTSASPRPLQSSYKPNAALIRARERSRAMY